MSSFCDVWIERCREMWRAREVVTSRFLVGLDFELEEGASVDTAVVRSRFNKCRWSTLILMIRSFGKMRFIFLEANM